MAATLGLFMFAAAAPSPLYALTEAFGVYALALLLALLLTGSLSDAVGRRPMILAAVVIELASMFLFVVASDVNWLFAARSRDETGRPGACVFKLSERRRFFNKCKAEKI